MVLLAKALIAQNKPEGEAKEHFGESVQDPGKGQSPLHLDFGRYSANIDPVLAAREAWVDLYTALGEKDKGQRRRKTNSTPGRLRKRNWKKNAKPASSNGIEPAALVLILCFAIAPRVLA